MKYELFIANRILSYKSEKQKNISKYITKIALFSISLGLIIMIISISTGIGLKEEIRDKISGFNGHLQIISLDYSNKIIATPISINQSFYPKNQNLKNIKYMQPFANVSGIIKSNEDFEGIIVKGVDQNYNWNFIKNYIIEGEIPFYKKNERNDTIIISQNISNLLNINLHDKVRMIFFKENSVSLQRVFVVGAIFNTGMNQFDNNNIFSCIWHVQKINKWEEDQISGFEVIIDNFDNITKVGRNLYNRIESDLDVRTIYDTNYNLLGWVELFDINIYSIIFIMIIISAINIITVLITFILERINMIGILKILGNSNISIRKIFVIISIKMLVKGLIYGNIIALIIILSQNFFGIIKLDPNIYHTKKAPFDLNFLYILFLNIGVIFLCTIMMILPSYIISKITPSKSIKFD